MRISGTLRGVSDANSRKVQLNQNQTIYGRITQMTINFEMDTMVAANIITAERNIASHSKDDTKESADGIQRNKITVYCEITAVLVWALVMMVGTNRAVFAAPLQRASKRL